MTPGVSSRKPSYWVWRKFHLRTRFLNKLNHCRELTMSKSVAKEEHHRSQFIERSQRVKTLFSSDPQLTCIRVNEPQLSRLSIGTPPSNSPSNGIGITIVPMGMESVNEILNANWQFQEDRRGKRDPSYRQDRISASEVSQALMIKLSLQQSSSLTNTVP